MGPLSMYFTEEEPPLDIIGKKRHYFGKPSIRRVNAANQGIGNAINNDIPDADQIPISGGDNISNMPLG